MTLRRQLYLAITALFCALLLTNLAVNLYGMRERSYQEMLLHARNATLSIHELSAGDDAATVMATRIAVWFDSQYFQNMTYRNLSGEVIVQRNQELNIDHVPGWFVALVQLPTVHYGTDVTVDERPVGTIEVTIQPTIAYQSLWSVFREQSSLFALFIVLTYGFAHMALKLLLSPLQKVEEQAVAICERHFVEITDLPKALEVRRVAETMNCMSRRLKTVFDEQLVLTENLRAQSYLDPVTNLSNRRDFNSRLQSLAENEAGNGGCLLLLQIDDFGRYNLKRGHESGDECLRVVAAHLQTVTANTPDAIISRRAGADFAVFLPRMDQESAKLIAEQLIIRLGGLDILFEHRVHIGLACCETLQVDHRLLSEADLALRQAQSQSQSGWKLYQDGDVLQVAREARQWYATLNRVLLDRNLILHYQPMFHVDDESAGCCEVFCRITVQNQLVPAGVFLPMAERFGLAAAFDRMILEEICKQSGSQPQGMRYCVNLSPQTLLSHEFFMWLGTWLAEHAVFASQLVVETSEYLVRTGNRQVAELCKLLHRHKACLSLDHFGVHTGAFGYLRSLPLDYLKIDRSFIRGIHEDKDHQFYVQSLIQIAHSCDVTVFAEGVESQDEWECLLALGVDGGQGYYLGRPAAVPELAWSVPAVEESGDDE